MDNVFEFVKDYGITSEENYPYKGKKKRCKKPLRDQPAAQISGYKRVAQYNWKELVRALNVGPVSVAVQAGQRSFMYYWSGVIDSDCQTYLDHGVLATGYDTSAAGGAIGWKSGLQSLTAMSSLEAELIASCSALMDDNWFVNILDELGFPMTGAVPLYQDNE